MKSLIFSFASILTVASTATSASASIATTSVVQYQKATAESPSSGDEKAKKPFWKLMGGRKDEKQEQPADDASTEKANERHQRQKKNTRVGFFRRPKTTDQAENEEDEGESPKRSEEETKTSSSPQVKDDDQESEKEDIKGEKEDIKEVEEKEEKVHADDGEEKKEDASDSHKRQQQLSTPSYSVVYRTSPLTMQSSPGGHGPSPQSQALIAGALLSLFNLTCRLFTIKWLVSKLSFDTELKKPEQHFVWECLNDKYEKDDNVWKSVRCRPPESSRLSTRKWDKIVKGMGTTKEESKKKDVPSPPIPSKTVVVIDLSTMKNQEDVFPNFSNMVTFLVNANARYKKYFGSEPEVILNIESPGGEVTSFALAAANVSRLRMAGWKVTACIDHVAASGGYMIASQATEIVAAPFAMLGSVGVYMETVNVHNVLKNYGVKSIVLKAGEMKNPITLLGDVTDKDLKLKQEDLEDTHRSFIELCRSKRTGLDPSVCNGRILSGDTALEKGMIDRILTSEEYIFEKISDGDLVMKLHLSTPISEQWRYVHVLKILPHLQQKLKSALTILSSGSFFGGLNEIQASLLRLDTNFINSIVQGVALASMIQRAVQRSGRWKNSSTK